MATTVQILPQVMDLESQILKAIDQRVPVGILADKMVMLGAA